MVSKSERSSRVLLPRSHSSFASAAPAFASWEFGSPAGSESEKSDDVQEMQCNSPLKSLLHLKSLLPPRSSSKIRRRSTTAAVLRL
ncbi:hypothetical protein L596_008130 [Steinernema carpocapsae]|uniref:Uncharacterized protein n=1 Tax=Steinernema carpocapsae TaxID=34508 RepID=A0A4U5PC25_STECR|nr:hypothetical protein L596_008130 [Steinernema carpocapsae]